MHLDDVVWNLQNPRTFHWTRDLLPVLTKQGLEFEAVDVNTWLKHLRQYSERTPIAAALRLNPAVKLIDFYEKAYGHGITNESDSSCNCNGKAEGHEVKFDTTLAERDSVNLRSSPDVLDSGLMGKIVQHWLQTWPTSIA